MSVRDIATLIRSEESRRWVEPFRDLYAIPTYGNAQLPHVNPMLPALCFGGILKKSRHNDYTSASHFQPEILRRNEVTLLEINRLETRDEACRLRDLAAELPRRSWPSSATTAFPYVSSVPPPAMADRFSIRHSSTWSWRCGNPPPPSVR